MQPPEAQPRRRRLVVMAVPLLIGLGLLGWAAAHYWLTPARADLARQAEEDLRKRKWAPLSGSLRELLTAKEPEVQRTQDHDLLGGAAPAFELTDADGKPWRLRDQLAKGPVVLVFYYGYFCDHCVSQLFGLQKDLRFFHELGAEVVAVSADPPELTRQRFRQYGAFDFPVLSDPGNKVGQSYRVFTPGDGKRPDVLQHGTFVLDRDGTVQWAQVGDEPFVGNRTLLVQLARLQGRLPTEAPR
jgi:peroxiredoxin